MNARELKQMRLDARMTIEQAARYALVSPRTWARWESGKVKIPERGVKLFELTISLTSHNNSLQAKGSNHGET
jgi:DNA-binding transcriptional regulator YiaG